MNNFYVISIIIWPLTILLHQTLGCRQFAILLYSTVKKATVTSFPVSANLLLILIQ
jgi:hypothetical protein